MHSTIRDVAKLYLVGGVWFASMLVAALLAHLSMTAVYWATDASPEVRVITTMTLAVAAASSIARIVWVRALSTQRAKVSAERASRQTSGADSPEASLAPIR